METIKSIELGFENCEVCKLLPDMFKYLIIQGVKENIDINCYQYENGEINRSKSCEYFSIIINEKGLNTITWNGTLRERLKYYKDIVSVTIYYEHRDEEICVVWNEENDYSNKYQTIEETEEGSRVKISKGNGDNDYKKQDLEKKNEELEQYIDIQSIEEISIRPYKGFIDICNYLEKKGNELIKSIKQLDKNISRKHLV